MVKKASFKSLMSLPRQERLHLSLMCRSRDPGGGGTPEEGVSAGRTGLGEVVEWNERHGHQKEKDSGVKKLIFIISSNGEREEGLKRLKRLCFYFK